MSMEARWNRLSKAAYATLCDRMKPAPQRCPVRFSLSLADQPQSMRKQGLHSNGCKDHRTNATTRRDQLIGETRD